MISTVTKWFPDNGYGFIAHPQGQRDLFCHFTDIIQKAGEPSNTILYVGESVEFEIGQGKKGPVAKRVRRLS